VSHAQACQLVPELVWPCCHALTRLPFACAPGTLPSEWQLPALATLALGDTLLTGTLPASWGQPGNLDGLFQLSLRGCRLNGEWRILRCMQPFTA